MLELLESEAHVATSDDALRKLHCFKKNCSSMPRFLAAPDKVNGTDNSLQIPFFDNSLVTSNMSLGCGCSGESLGK